MPWTSASGGYDASNPPSRHGRGRSDFALPYPKDGVALCLKEGRCPEFAIGDAHEFCLPGGGVGTPGRSARVLRAAMPITSVYKHPDPRAGEVYIERQAVPNPCVETITQAKAV